MMKCFLSIDACARNRYLWLWRAYLSNNLLLTSVETTSNYKHVFCVCGEIFPAISIYSNVVLTPRTCANNELIKWMHSLFQETKTNDQRLDRQDKRFLWKNDHHFFSNTNEREMVANILYKIKNFCQACFENNAATFLYLERKMLAPGVVKANLEMGLAKGILVLLQVPTHFAGHCEFRFQLKCQTLIDWKI